MKMEKKEFDKWTEDRKQGAWKYALKNSLIALLIVFCIYFFGNMYTHRERLDFYIYSFQVQWLRNVLTLLFVFSILVPLNLFFWRFNEKRYLESDANKAEDKSPE